MQNPTFRDRIAPRVRLSLTLLVLAAAPALLPGSHAQQAPPGDVFQSGSIYDGENLRVCRRKLDAMPAAVQAQHQDCYTLIQKGLTLWQERKQLLEESLTTRDADERGRLQKQAAGIAEKARQIEYEAEKCVAVAQRGTPPPSSARQPLKGNATHIDLDADGNKVDWSDFDQGMRELMGKIQQDAGAKFPINNPRKPLWTEFSYTVSRTTERQFGQTITQFKLYPTPLRLSGNTTFDNWVQERLMGLNKSSGEFNHIPPFPPRTQKNHVVKKVSIGGPFKNNKYDKIPDEYY